MDNLTHSLVGIALSRAFFKKRMALATTTLVIAANAPDLDLLWSWHGIRYLQYHRGIAHSFLALPVWVVLITAAIYGFARWRKMAPPPLWMAAVGVAVGVTSHLLLDFTNSYGIRLLDPWNKKWFSLDWEYIIDPWLWLMLAMLMVCPMILNLIGEEVGARKRPHRFSAALALVLLCGWMGLRQYQHANALSLLNTSAITDYYNGSLPEDEAALPVLASPFQWNAVVALPKSYVLAAVNSNSGTIQIEREFIKPPNDRLIQQAESTRTAGVFLDFARFPLADVETLENGWRVNLTDVRFSDQGRRPAIRAQIGFDQAGRITAESFSW